MDHPYLRAASSLVCSHFEVEAGRPSVRLDQVCGLNSDCLGWTSCSIICAIIVLCPALVAFYFSCQVILEAKPLSYSNQSKQHLPFVGGKIPVGSPRSCLG